MAFVLNALIADFELLRGAPGLVVVSLPGGRGLVPLTNDLWRENGHHSLPLLRGEESGSLPRTTSTVRTSARAHRGGRRLVRVDRRIVHGAVGDAGFGGRGGQAAVVWEAGEQVLGPLIDEAAINQAIARIGVARVGGGDDDGDDEFTMLQLGRYRRTSEWLKLA